MRVVDGREIEGRFISEKAYALYARAAAAEARGELEPALAAYVAAAAEDSGSAEIWTRIGAVRCELQDRHGAAADAFRRAASYDPEYEPLWRERARCALAAGRADEALAATTLAVSLDPNRPDTAVLHATALERAGRTADARRELEALAVRHPGSADAWRALGELAARTGDAPAAERAARHARALAPRLARDLERAVPALSPLAEIDAALLEGDLRAARRRAKAAHVAASELGVRAAALGRPAIAREQAGLIVAADPADASSRIALAAAADLSGDTAGVEEAMRGLDVVSPGAASPLARLLFAELLARRVGADAARAWLGGAFPADERDPLIARLRQRLVW